jgi:hypothetical protein
VNCQCGAENEKKSFTFYFFVVLKPSLVQAANRERSGGMVGSLAASG